MANPSQEPPVSSKAPNQDLKDMDVLCTFKFKIEPKFGTWVNQRPVTMFKSVSRCKTPVRILQHPQKPKIRTLGAQIVFAPSKIKIKSQNSECGSTKDQ